jgi:hypothetical protein
MIGMTRAVAKPGQRDLRQAAAGPVRYGFDGRDDSAGPLLLRHLVGYPRNLE